MERRFKNISYNLAENIINFEKVELKSLKHYSLMSFIVRICKEKKIINFITTNAANIMLGTEPSNYFEIGKEITRIITEVFIFPKILFNSCNVNKIRAIINEIVFFVAVQICDMLRKNKASSTYIIDAKFILQNLVLNCEGTINLKKTARRILSRTTTNELTPYYKCKLGCYHFMEEIVLNRYATTLNLKQFRGGFESYFNDETINKFLYFWKWFIRRCNKYLLNDFCDYETFIIRVKNSSLDEEESVQLLINIFETSVTCNNENAVHYLWFNYISKMPNSAEILKYVLNLAIPCTDKTNVSMYLISQVNNNELEHILKSNYFIIIRNIVQNIRWHSLFGKFFNEVKNYFEVDDFLNLLTCLTHTYFIDSPTFIALTLNYVNSLPDSVKHCLRNKSYYIYNDLLSKPFSNLKKDLLISLLKLINKVKLDNFLCSNSGINLLAEPIKNGNLEFCDKILQETLSRDIILELKRKLFYCKIEILSKHFMQHCQFKNLCSLMDWLSEAVSENMDKFKETLLLKYNGHCFREMIFKTDIESNYNPILRAIDFLFWCLKSEESVTLFIKENISLCKPQTYSESKNVISCYEDLKILMMESNWDRLAMFFNWINCTLEVKRALIQDLLNDKVFHSQIITNIKEKMLLLDSLIFILSKYLDLDVEDDKIFKIKLYEAFQLKYPFLPFDFPTFLDWTRTIRQGYA
ncbi:UNVERIFIED_CONTAM: hypothetical protein RMT77_018092 [Armadillidium vulgare]